MKKEEKGDGVGGEEIEDDKKENDLSSKNREKLKVLD